MEDFLYSFLDVFQKLPLFIQNLIGAIYNKIPIKIRYGYFYGIYTKRITSYEESTFNQNILIEEQINSAIRNIPFYKNKGKLLSSFPIINKNIILDRKDKFIDDKLKKECLKANTGGTSGTPFTFCLHKKKSRSKEKAHFNWYWKKFGYERSEKILVIRGKSLKKGEIFEYQVLDNKLKISCYGLNYNNFNSVIKEIWDFSPNYIHAYPSALKIFTTLMIEHNYQLNNIKAIFLGSEYLSDYDRSFFNKIYKAKVINWYGHSESLVFAGNCLYSKEFHIYPFYGYLELVNEKGEIIIEPNKIGRIVATGFDNNVMPLIRYDTGDLAEYSCSRQCKCGFRGKSLKKIHGRGQDYIFLNDSTKVSVTAFIFGQHFVEFERIKELQIIQNTNKELIVKISVNNLFSEKDEINLVRKLEKSVNNKLEVYVKRVESIPKTEMGKHKILIQNLKME